MTRHELLRHIILQAHTNGFDFRAWHLSYIAPEWAELDTAIEHLCVGRNCYALIFSHEFARCFWKSGQQMTVLVPPVSYPQRAKNGSIMTIHRRAFTRRTLKADSWLYHLAEMARAPHPLKYLRRFIVSQEDVLAARRRDRPNDSKGAA